MFLKLQFRQSLEGFCGRATQAFGAMLSNSSVNMKQQVFQLYAGEFMWQEMDSMYTKR